MELITVCRSNEDLRTAKRERCRRVKVTENTDFYMIMSADNSSGNPYPYFAYNGLTTFQTRENMPYLNSTKNWKEKYNATIVHPICKCMGYDSNGKVKYKVLGFLCVDSPSTTAFVDEQAKMCIGFNKAMAALLYRVLDRCAVQREIIESEETINV